MTKTPPAHLRLVPNDPTSSTPLAGEAKTLSQLKEAFREVTGWELRIHEGSPAGRTSDEADRLRVVRAPGPSANSAVPQAHAERLAEALSPLLKDLQSTRQALVAREAELAAGIPVRVKPDEQHLAQRLEAILKGGAQAVGCRAAGLYLLDDATTTLKLRSSFGLPAARLCDPPRQLRGALADLEALVGHAVVLEDTRTLPHWKPPENFPAAACVPVSSPSMPLGTLWVFAEEPRDFTSEQTNLLEIIAGRISAELERETLLGAGVDAHNNDRQRDNVSHWQRSRLPSISPLVDGWEIGGFSLPAGAVSREFFDWQVLPDGQLCVALGAGSGLGMAAALNASALHAAYKAHTQYPQAPARLLRRLNETLYSAGQGDQFGAIGFAAIAPAVGRGSFASAGGPAAVVIRQDGAQLLGGAVEWLGQEPEQRFAEEPVRLAPGDVLLLVSAELVAEGDEGAFDPESLGEFVARYRRHSLEGMLSALQKLVFRAAEDTDRDATVIAVRRLGR